MKILWSQEKKLASQDNFLAFFFFLKMTFFGFFFCCFANKLGEFFLAFLGRFFFRANNGTPLGGGG